MIGRVGSCVSSYIVGPLGKEEIEPKRLVSEFGECC
jgi:hypothetical protein